MALFDPRCPKVEGLSCEQEWKTGNISPLDALISLAAPTADGAANPQAQLSVPWAPNQAAEELNHQYFHC